MNNLSGMFAGAFTSIAASVSSCCGRFDEKPHRHGLEKSFVIDEQPGLVPSPGMTEPAWQSRAKTSTWERAPRKRHGSGWSSFSGRRRLGWGSSSSRRPQISAPSNFRHVYSESFRFPGHGQTRPRPRSFRPLELSIYMAANRLSPMLPHFEYLSISPETPPVTPPERALINPDRSGDGDLAFSHQNSSWSSLSFHVPRKPTDTGSVSDSLDTSPEVIQYPSPARVMEADPSEEDRYDMDDLLERIATAMLERDRIQSQIDDVVERQSVYAGSSRRPSVEPSISSFRMYSSQLADMEPMPDIPALPPDAPSFSERLSSDRPRTAPSKAPVYIAQRVRASTDASSPSTPLSPATRRAEGRAPPPPLPLRLRPPLRKKKSFSRVSNWLGFPGEQRQNDGLSLESITTNPKAIQLTDGFYQVASSKDEDESVISPSSETVSDWSVSADAEEEQTVPTWSPSSTTIKALESPQSVVFAPERASRVGMAF